MDDLLIVEKPNSISYEDIQNILRRAHSVNKEKGMNFLTADQSVDRLIERLSNNGKCYVVLTQEGKLVGTNSVTEKIINKWYFKGRIAYFELTGLDPQYQGKHIGSQMYRIGLKDVERRGLSICGSNTAENNMPQRQLFESKGFKLVGYRASVGKNYYTVDYVKWMGKCPYEDNYIKLRAFLSKIYIKVRFKVGGVKRFGL